MAKIKEGTLPALSASLGITGTIVPLQAARRAALLSRSGRTSSKPSQYGGGQEAARQAARQEERRRASRLRAEGAVGGILEARERVREQNEQLEDQIEERQDILDDSGGSSDSTIVVGDDADEEVRAIGAYNVYYKVNPVAISGGYIQYMSLSLIALNDDPTYASELQYIQDNKTNRGFIMYRTIRFTVGTDTSSLEDFYFLTDMPTPSLSTSLNKYFYSQEEKGFLNSRLKTGTRLNLVGLTAAVESFFQIEEAGRFEGSIITNRIESTKKLKLTSLPSDTPSQPRTESTTSPGSSY
jgi:hypothetical protein